VILFYLLIAIMPLEAHRFWGGQVGGPLTIVKLVGLLCFLVAAFRILAQGSRPPFFQSATSWWYAAFFLLQCSSYLVQGGKLANPGGSYSQIVSFFLLYVSTLTLVNSRPRLRRALLVAIGAVGFTSLYAIREWQKYHGIYAEFRPGGMLSDANEYALIAGLWMPMAFLWAFGKRPRWEKVFCMGCLACCLLGTAFAASRGCILGMAASFLFLIWHSPQRARNLALAALLLVPIGLIGAHSVLDRYLHPSHSDQLAKEARFVAWQAGWNMITAHPMFGVGLENFKAEMPYYQATNIKTDTVAHNTYVEITAELGVPALLLFLGMWVASFRMLGRVRVRTRKGRLRGLFPIALGLQAGIVGYMVNAFFLSTSWYKMVWLLLFLSLCLNHLEEAARAPQIEEEATYTDWASYLDAQPDRPTPVL
jgi:O-antigen ligase